MISDEKLLDIYQLKNLVRYNTRQRLSNETVAEHSFFVALMSLMICDELKLSDELKLRIIIKSLLHDMPEIEINDITHDVKERLNLRALLEKYEMEYYENNFPKYVELMKDDDTIETAVMCLADILSVRQYALHELELGNNSESMKKISRDAHDRVMIAQIKLNKILEGK